MRLSKCSWTKSLSVGHKSGNKVTLISHFVCANTKSVLSRKPASELRKICWAPSVYSALTQGGEASADRAKVFFTLLKRSLSSHECWVKFPYKGQGFRWTSVKFHSRHFKTQEMLQISSGRQHSLGQTDLQLCLSQTAVSWLNKAGEEKKSL